MSLAGHHINARSVDSRHPVDTDSIVLFRESQLSMGGATGMASMAMAISSFGVPWPLMALVIIARFELYVSNVYTNLH